MSRFVRPDVTVLKISRGDTLTVKRRLNAGEQRAMYAKTYLARADGTLATNPFETGINLVLAYLVDWSLTDDAGSLVAIRDQSPEKVRSILDGLDPDDFLEIRVAIDAHDDAMRQQREAEKNALDGATGSSAISPSPSIITGALTTSDLSTQTNTTVSLS